ncbi:MAG: 4-alpha-glucanotransferase [Planctomycetota bacterium]|nr:MAG: 4-alpha-glucanotransferase [Planctomycetota bacterium]
MRTKRRLLGEAFRTFQRLPAAHPLQQDYEHFCAEHAWWLDDFALFMALAERYEHRPWNTWPDDAPRPGTPWNELAKRVDDDLATAVRRLRFEQFVFFRQWEKLHAHAKSLGIRIFGDMPFYVAYQSPDVWANRRYFQLDETGNPIEVGGVPPDGFSANGQLWGHPVYSWEALAADGFRWWVDRLRACCRMVDLTRLDHFRGFAAYWSIPAHHKTARHGRWVPAPGDALLQTLLDTWEGPWEYTADNQRVLPIVAEDLGHITEDVVALRRRFHLPGMIVLQFVLGNPTLEHFLPANAPEDTVIYTGTHDNNTSRGWHETEVAPDSHFRARVDEDLGGRPEDVARRMIELAWQAGSRMAVAPLQDVLSLGAEHRMNIPGTPTGNWRWRFSPTDLTPERADWLAELTADTGRSVAVAAGRADHGG